MFCSEKMQLTVKVVDRHGKDRVGTKVRIEMQMWMQMKTKMEVVTPIFC